MQTLALLLLLGVVASTMFGFAPSVLAQDAPVEEPTEEETLDEETTDEEITDEETDDAMEDTMEEMPEDEVMEDAMETTMMEEITSPLQQLKSGTDPHEIQCGDGMQLVFKASNFRPACIKESSHDVLLQRGWVSDHDPSHEELTGMMENIPKDEVMEEETEETEEEIELDEEIEVEGDSTPTNGTEPTQQSYTIELAESMEMGAN
jgi:hypothetical protein